MKGKIDGFCLKIIAVIAMLFNHIGQCFHLADTFPWFYLFTEVIGKLTFPIMAFMLVEGFQYTRDRKKYALRLAFFSLVSAYPFWLCLKQGWVAFGPAELVNNIMFTLLMGLCMLICYEKTNKTWQHVLIVLLFSFATSLSDWPVMGVLMIFGYYRIKHPVYKIVIPALYTGLLPVLLNLYYMFGRSFYEAALLSSIGGVLFTIPLLMAYNGKRGFNNAIVKWGFYAFYPVHLLALGVIKYFFF